MSVVDRLTVVAARLGKLPGRLGVPQYVRVVVQLPNGTQVVPEATWKVLDVSRETIGAYLSENVQVSGKELVISGVPRRTAVYQAGFTLDELRVSTYLIDATWDGTTWVGLKAKAVWVVDKDPLSFRVLVMPRETR